MHQLDAIWGSADQYMCLFYENSQKRRLVNLSEIISEAAAVIDCGSDGGKENQVGLTLTSHPRFSICLLVTNSHSCSKHGRHFSCFTASL